MLKQVLMGVALMCATGLWATEGVSDMAVRLFGKEAASKRVAEGALFVDGLYIKAPYSVTREGNVILVNGRIAARFEVKSAADDKAEHDARVAQNDPGADGSDAVSDEAGTAIGGEPDPIPDAPQSVNKNRGPSAMEEYLAKKGGGSIAERKAAKERAKALREKSSVGGFNKEATSADPLALFEEADYTYTPPSKPEPKAVPYIRPASQKSFKERVAEVKAREKEIAEQTTKSTGDGGDTIAVESFDNLSDEEIAAYTQRFTKFRELIEKSLAADRLVFLSSTNSGAKAEQRAVMRRFVASLDKLCAAPTSARLVGQWGKTLPRGYLGKIYDNREANAREMKALVQRVVREVKAERDRKAK